MAKALAGCGEISLLAHGQYQTAPARIAERLSAMRGASCPEALSGLAEDVAMAAEVLGHSSPRMEAGGWFRARDYAAALFSQVAGGEMTQPGRDAIEAGASYAPSRAGLAKNLEFVALVLLSQRRLAWRSVLSLRRVDRALRVALLYLSLALGSAGSVRGTWWIGPGGSPSAMSGPHAPPPRLAPNGWRCGMRFWSAGLIRKPSWGWPRANPEPWETTCHK